MADNAPAQETAAPQDPNTITLTPMDIVGVIQRHLGELNAYCNRSVQDVDPMVIRAYLERTWQFASRLPEVRRDAQAPANGGGKVSEKRAS